MSAAIVDFVRDATQLLDVLLDALLIDTELELSYMREEKEDIAVELLTAAERSPPNFSVPVRKPNGSVCIERVRQEREITYQIESIRVATHELRVRLDILQVDKCNCEVQSHVAMMDLISVEDVGQCHTDQPVIVPVGEVLKDLELRD